MKLWDRVTIHEYRHQSEPVGPVLAANVPAHIYSMDSLQELRLGMGWRIETTTRAILPATLHIALRPTEHQIMWRGERWEIDGLPVWRRKHGRDHHQTVTLRRVDSINN